MKVEIDVNGQTTEAIVTRHDGRFIVAIGSREWSVDAAELGGHVLSLLLEEHGRSTGNGNGRATNDPVTLSREIAIGTDPASGLLTFGVGALPLAVGINRRRRGRGTDAVHGASGPQRIVAPMPGKVVRVLGKVGDSVAQRQPVVVIEAMKMENELRASREGVLTEIHAQEGQSVEAGALLAVISQS